MNENDSGKQLERVMGSLAAGAKLHSSIMPSRESMATLPLHYMIYLPALDDIGGDFLLRGIVGDGNDLLGVADATGHSVEGALLAERGVVMFNMTLLYKDDIDPDEMLGIMNTLMFDAIDCDKEDRPNNSLDIGMVRIDTDQKIINFSGAKRPLWLYRGDDKIILRGDRHSVGGDSDRTIKQFSAHSMPYESGDLIYMFSDGFPDQFGGSLDKKLKSKGLDSILRNSHEVPFTDRERFVVEAFDEWKGGRDQVDDVLILSIELT